MKIRLVAPSVKCELPESVLVSRMPGLSNPKVMAAFANYVAAAATAIVAIGTLSFPKKVMDFRQLQGENPWLAEIAQTSNVQLETRKSGQSVGRFTLSDVISFLQCVTFQNTPDAVEAEEIEL